ncbi:major capsid protein [Rhodovulum sulfidophilum]|uniref:Phage major capsid protein n=1 Tax=Rhodovulum visakhapatnamense TaxID=364297 RepID=A0ABS1RHZ6_9RHOB|nr:phage major capsid protein [Rhodovulum visakhapatnamense]MBL3568869.1 phage major capsid protein [Rhodovulum visakhapatnamense]MBL3579223.1 phage major capsid protein [Rhodovulum visakhapatnamense]OLS44483.1 major capsid protein [Rhodovulum sulfidophilum]
MLTSVTIARRQSEIRQRLSELVGKDAPSEDETRQMDQLDGEYRQNETRYRAALIAEDTERREAGADLETRSGREWNDLVAGFQMRQVIGALNEGRALDGKTAEVVAELRSAGGYRGVPVPLLALEARAGETVSAGTPDPVQTRPIIDRLFPASVAARMGAQMIAIGSGAVEWPVATSAVTAGWADGETGTVADPTPYTTTDKALKPEHNLGVQMRITRKALLQSGDALEAAIRRDMNGAMAAELDRAIFLGTGAAGQPLGVITGAATYGVTVTPVDAAASWATYRGAVVRFMARNAASTPADVRALIRPEVWDFMEDQLTATAAPKFEFDRMAEKMGGIAMSSTALEAPTGTPAACTSLLTTSAGGVAPVFVGMWGAVDLIRDPFSDAASGGLRLTALTTMDITVARGAQLEILTGVQVA